MSYRIAGIDVHKKMLAVVIADVAADSEYQFERRKVGTSPEQLRLLAEWLVEQEVEEVVMESTAQYWKPVWQALEQYWKPACQQREGAGRMSGALHLAQAKSNRGPRGRKNDFADAERLVKRLVAQELILSFVPDAEQRLWRTVTRRKQQLIRDRVRLQNQLEALLEQAHIKLSSVVSDLLGVSGAAYVAGTGGRGDRCRGAGGSGRSPVARHAGTVTRCAGRLRQLSPVYRRLLQMTMEELKLLEQHLDQLDKEISGVIETAPGGGPAAGGSARSGGGFGPSDHRRSRRYGSGFSFG